VATAIGSSLPFAVAAAVSPIPISIVILIQLAHPKDPSSLLFATGRILGYAVVLTIVILAAEVIRPGLDAAPSVTGLIARLGVGALSLGVGIWTWLQRRSGGETKVLRAWLRVVEGVTPMRAGGAGLAVSVGPKNLLLLAGGGLALAGTPLSPVGLLVPALVFLAIATSTVSGPVLLYYALGARAVAMLNSWQGWIQDNTIAISGLLLVLVGVVLIGSGVIGL
jgi:hypothetical protein